MEEKHPMLSRKLWMTILSVAITILSMVNGSTDTQTGVQVIAGAIAAYTVSQGYADGQKKQKKD